MEKITDIFKELRERLINPLFSSFIIAWVVINWRIPVGLIFYSNANLKVDGYNSYMDLIAKNYSSWHYVVYPFLISFVYTFAFPFFRNVIFAFQTWIKTKSTNWNLEISRVGKVSMERYIQLKQKYYEQSKTLEQLFTDEGKYLDENKELNVEKAKLFTENNKLSSDLNYWNSMNDSRVLNGEWDYSFRASITDEIKAYRVEISGNQFYLYKDASKRDRIEIYNIQDFFCNPFSRRLCLALVPMSTPGKTIFHNLQFPNGISELRGTEDGTYTIVYRKLAE